MAPIQAEITLTAAITMNLANKGQVSFKDYADIDRAPEEKTGSITINASAYSFLIIVSFF